ncbi:MAG: hypothetical protein LBC40_07795 [Dysgonamonadaceae bacterium]|jgi:hypothetical protein|nr:hypothetical protein [Dysgonamonadaceae bacterium]
MKQYILFLMAVVFMAACKDEENLEITSLSKGGNTFYFGEKVPVWTMLCSNPGNVSYDWECTGGVFDGHSTQHLFENLWIAPHQPGEYTVQVTANLDGQSESRQTSMKVTNFYTDTFDDTRNPAGWVTSGATAIWNVGALTIQNLNDTREAAIYKVVSVSDDLKPPFSLQMQMNYSAYRTGVTNVGSASGITLRIAFSQPPVNPEKPFVQYLSWIFCPVATGNNAQLVVSAYTPEIGRSSTAYSVATRDARLSFPSNETHVITLTLDSDLLLTASCDGQAIIDKNDAIRQFVNDNGIVQDFEVRELRIVVPRKTSANAIDGETELNVTRLQINDSRTAIGGDVNNIGFEELP